MDYFEGVVTDYLSADRAMFVNPQCLIQISAGDTPKKGEYWYCDILAVNFRESRAYLCEVTLSRSLAALDKRLREWSANWPLIRDALKRDNLIPTDWDVRPWVFVPKDQEKLAERKLSQLHNPNSGREQMPEPLVTFLEDVTPWKYETPRRPPYPGDATA
jgi:hypothetical protein